MTPKLRRSWLLLLIALLVFAGAVAWRLLAPPVSADTQPTTSNSAAHVNRLQRQIARSPQDVALYAQLSLAYLQRARETGDAAYYTLAERALDEAQAARPDSSGEGQTQALLGHGMLALSRHDFQAALVHGRAALAENSYSAEAYGLLVDAYVELGQYEKAVSTLQEMIDLKPNLASYSRVSYVRELHGDVEGAIDAMQLAAESGAPGLEETVWTRVQLGHLYFNQGQFERAEQQYQQVLEAQPDYPYAQAGLGRVAAARGNLQQAIAIYRPLVERYPLAEFAAALGELYAASGRPQAAQEQFGLVRAIQQLNEEAGMDVDLELALFNADRRLAPEETVQMARALYERRPTIYAADALAWALYQAGQYQEARRYSDEALRLGTRDALLYYHAGMILHALGDEASAHRELQKALAINPAFSIRYAPQAQALLHDLIAAQ